MHKKRRGRRKKYEQRGTTEIKRENETMRGRRE